MSLEDLDNSILKKIDEILEEQQKMKENSILLIEKMRLNKFDKIDQNSCKTNVCQNGECFNSLVINSKILKTIFKEVMDEVSCDCSMTNNICENCNRKGYTFKIFINDTNDTICVINMYRKNNVDFTWKKSPWHITFHKKFISRDSS